jgi:hypothetical protein
MASSLELVKACCSLSPDRAASVSAWFLVAVLVAGIVVVAVRYDDINATPDANSAAQMASNPITARSKEFHLKCASMVLMGEVLRLKRN